MPPKNIEKKKPARKNKRKSRTEIASSSSSSDNESITSPKTKTKTPAKAPEEASDSDSEKPNDSIPIPQAKPPQPKQIDSDQAFQDFYLRQATREFANDLDRLRSASDFHGERSVGMLVRALKAGTECFDARERERVVGQ